MARTDFGCVRFFVRLGYVDKFLDTIHQISYHHVVHPYVPYISPSGRVGITGPGSSSNRIIELDSKRYSNFVKTARDFQNQRISGKHPHITEFNYGVNFHYESDVYEVKDRYFDAIDIGYLLDKKTLTIHLTRPGIRLHNRIPHKLWKRISQLDLNLFLSGNEHIDRQIDELDWKKDYVGYIIHDNQAYNILNRSPESDQKENVNDDDDGKYLAMPNFLKDDDIYSLVNFLSNKFEDVTSDYLVDHLGKTGYIPSIRKRLKLPYLNKKEIDIIAEQKTEEGLLMIICECKFREHNSPVLEGELEEFTEKVLAIREHESKQRSNIIFDSWLVTNSDNISNELKNYASVRNIKIKKAKLNNNFMKRADWKITHLYDLN